MLHWTKQKNSNSGQFPREAWEQYNKIKTLHHLIANSKLSPRFLENKLASVWSMGSNFGNLNWIGIWETEKQVWCGCRKIEKIWSKHLLQTRAQFSFYEDNCQPRQFWFKPLIIWKRCPFWSKTKRIREVKLTYGRSWSEWRSPFRAPIAEVSHLTKKASKFLATIITSEQNRQTQQMPKKKKKVPKTTINLEASMSLWPNRAASYCWKQCWFQWLWTSSSSESLPQATPMISHPRNRRRIPTPGSSETPPIPSESLPFACLEIYHGSAFKATKLFNKIN